jgi:hypothetical protein
MEAQDLLTKRTGLGAGIGAMFGFFFGSLPGAALGAAIGGAIANVTPPIPGKPKITNSRKMIFEAAINGTKTPAELRTLADAFAGEGLHAQAAMLRKRADLREMPEAYKKERREVFRRTMALDDPEEIDRVAATFDAETAMDAARALRDHANAVRAAHAAGKSAAPLPDDRMIADFGDKLAKAVIHYGPASDQARTAAANFIQARGKPVTAEAVAESIAWAEAEVAVEPPARAANGSSAAGPTAAEPVPVEPTGVPTAAAASSPDAPPGAVPAAG